MEDSGGRLPLLRMSDAAALRRCRRGTPASVLRARDAHACRRHAEGDEALEQLVRLQQLSARRSAHATYTPDEWARGLTNALRASTRLLLPELASADLFDIYLYIEANERERPASGISYQNSTWACT